MTNVDLLWYIRCLGSALFCKRSEDDPNILWKEEVVAEKLLCLEVPPVVPLFCCQKNLTSLGGDCEK